MTRTDNQNIARETLQICEQRYYEYMGTKCDLGITEEELLSVNVYRPEQVANIKRRMQQCIPEGNSEILVKNMDSFEAAERYGKGKTLVMNFANAHHPGGGFLRGARAQEESLCRCSSLYLSIAGKQAQEMYRYNKEHYNAFDSEYMLISPRVSVFRNSDCSFRPKPFITSVVTIAAPNLGCAARGVPQKYIDADMERKIENLCAVAASEGYRTLVLGAWGCGAFRHDAARVAGYFRKVLIDGKYAGFFDAIVFACLCGRDTYNYDAFVKVFTK